MRVHKRVCVVHHSHILIVFIAKDQLVIIQVQYYLLIPCRTLGISCLLSIRLSAILNRTFLQISHRCHRSTTYIHIAQQQIVLAIVLEPKSLIVRASNVCLLKHYDQTQYINVLKDALHRCLSSRCSYSSTTHDYCPLLPSSTPCPGVTHCRHTCIRSLGARDSACLRCLGRLVTAPSGRLPRGRCVRGQGHPGPLLGSQTSTVL